jgi:tetratricopeptide (TPR) repeat protein
MPGYNLNMHKPIKRWMVPFAMIHIFVCLSWLSRAQSIPPSAEKTPGPDFSQEAAVIEELITTARFENDGSSQQTVREKVKVQNQAGLKQFGIITFNFIVGQEFHIDTVEVHKPDDTIVKTGAENVQEVTPEISRVAPMYSDLHQKQVTVPGLALGDELVFQYTSKQTALVANHFWFQHTFTRDAIVLAESVELNLPKDRKVRLHYQPEYKPVTKDAGDRTLYQWHSSNEKIEDERRSLRVKELMNGTAPPLSIELSTFDTWEQVGAWYYALQHERETVTPAIKAKALELTKGIDQPAAKTRTLYEFVSASFRYISLDFGIGRYQPHAADQVLSNGYGDCKDKHTLLAALLDAVGIHVYPVLINTHREIDPQVPSPAQFDHLMTAVPNGKDLVFLDTTGEIAPYGMIMLPLRNKKALVIDGPASIRLAETPANPPFPVQEVFEFNGKVDDSGTMEADVSFFAHGDTEMLFKTALRQASPSKYKDLIHVLSMSLGFGGEVSDVKVTGLQDLENGLRIAYHYHRADYFNLTDPTPKNSLPLGALNLRPWNEKDEYYRFYTSPGELTYKCKVELPEGVTAQPPLPITLDRSFIHYVSTYSSAKNVVTCERKVSVLVPELGVSNRPDYESLRRAVNTDESQSVLLQLPPGFVAKATATAGGVEEWMRQGEIEARQRDYEAALADFRKVANREPNHKGVWTQIAKAESRLNRHDQALLDFRKAIEIDPSDVSAHEELAAEYMRDAGNADKIVAELHKASDIDPLDHRAHFLLGWYFVQRAKDYASAVPELEKALSTEQPGTTDMALVRSMLTTAYFKTNQREKGLEALQRMVEQSPDANTWNNAAYTLAENGYQLELAQKYAHSASHSLYQQLNGLQPDAIRRGDLVNVARLANTWDTVGWIYFKNGDAATAEKYVLAAWTLGQSREAGEHLGEIYEKLGKRQDAMRYYAMSCRENSTSDLAKDRLTKMVGASATSLLIREYRNEPSKLRTVHLGNIAPAETKGEFYFVFTPGPRLESIQPIKGEASLQKELEKLAPKIAETISFPEPAELKVVRHGLVVCTRYSLGCDLAFVPSTEFPGGSN